MEDFKNLWKDPKYNALIKLGLWIIFLLIIYVFIILSAQSIVRKNEEESKNNVYNQKVFNLMYNKLSVKYTLNDYYIEGIVEKNIFTGTIEYKDGTIYKIKYDGKNISKISNIEGINDEYLLISFRSEYLLPNYLSDLINNYKPTQKNDENYTYQINGIEYKIKQNETSIYEIIIKESDSVSKLEYSVLN